MNVDLAVFTEEVKTLSLESDFRTEEEYGISNLHKSYQDHSLYVTSHVFPHHGIDVPVLVLSPYNTEITLNELQRMNGGEIGRKLDISKDSYERFLGSFESKKDTRVTIWKPSRPVLDENMEYPLDDLWISKKSPILGSFYYGEKLAIFPDPYLLSFKEDEYKLEGYMAKVGKRKKEKLKLAIEERRAAHFAYFSQVLESMKNSIQQNGPMLSGGNSIFSSGTNLSAVPKEEREFFEKEQIFPFEITEKDNGKCVLQRINPEQLNLLVQEKRAYLQEKQMWQEKLDKVKDGLKNAGKSWYALNTSNKFDDGVWKFWLNPHEQYHYCSGWFTLEELEQWANNEGPVVKINN